ncbi:MAG TPA: hypothetical protein VJ547_11760 [Candidatus Thermoplasmatota archaeon]|nr:hypothetical protein [Candidatus Thermoplasmatota archaeon]
MPSRRAIKDSEDEERPPDDGDGRSTDPDEGPAPRKGGKAPRVAGRSTWQRFKAWFRDFRLYIYVAFFAASFLLFLLGILSIWAPRMLGPGLEGWFRSMGSYNSYLFFFGLVCIVTAAYLFFALLAKLAEFRRLASTNSKGDFVHSLDRIERLAFELGTHANEYVAQRKREFRIRH